jgi:hypothetical protein
MGKNIEFNFMEEVADFFEAIQPGDTIDNLAYGRERIQRIAEAAEQTAMFISGKEQYDIFAAKVDITESKEDRVMLVWGHFLTKINATDNRILLLATVILCFPLLHLKLTEYLHEKYT